MHECIGYIIAFTESVLLLPLYHEQRVRLREISRRLASAEASQPMLAEEEKG